MTFDVLVGLHVGEGVVEHALSAGIIFSFDGLTTACSYLSLWQCKSLDELKDVIHECCKTKTESGLCR